MTLDEVLKENERCTKLSVIGYRQPQEIYDSMVNYFEQLTDNEYAMLCDEHPELISYMANKMREPVFEAAIKKLPSAFFLIEPNLRTFEANRRMHNFWHDALKTATNKHDQIEAYICLKNLLMPEDFQKLYGDAYSDLARGLTREEELGILKIVASTINDALNYE